MTAKSIQTKYLTALVTLIFILLTFALPAVRADSSPRAFAVAGLSTCFYDYKIVEYYAASMTASSPPAALHISIGNVIYHIVDSSRSTPNVECVSLLSTLNSV